MSERWTERGNATQCFMPQESGKEGRTGHAAANGWRTPSAHGSAGRKKRAVFGRRTVPLAPAKCAISTKRLCVLTPGPVALLNSDAWIRKDLLNKPGSGSVLRFDGCVFSVGRCDSEPT